MANALEILKGGSALTTSEAYQDALDKTRRASGGGDYKSISIRGKVFRVMHGSEQVHTYKNGEMNIVLVDASPVVRTYYKGKYDPKAEKQQGMTCWSNDGIAPDPEVKPDNAQCKTCAKCPMNIKGSGANGTSKACQSRMNVTLCIENRWEDVYTLSVPAMSVFGKAEGNKFPLQAYFKTLAAHNTPMQAVITKVEFDDRADVAKLFFSPTDMVDAKTFAAIMQHAEDPVVAEKLKLTAPKDDDDTNDDDTNDEPKAATTARRKTAVVQDDEDDAPFEEPKKRGGRKAAAVVDTSAEDELDEW